MTETSFAPKPDAEHIGPQAHAAETKAHAWTERSGGEPPAADMYTPDHVSAAQQLEEVHDSVDHAYDRARIERAIDLLRTAGGEALRQFLEPEANELWQDAGFRREAWLRLGDVMTELVKSGKGLSEYERDFRVRAITSFGFEPEEAKDISSAWSTLKVRDNQGAIDPEKVDMFVKIQNQSFRVLERLKEANPAIPADLYRTAGIRRFSRYDSQDLVEQYYGYDQIDLTVVSAASDHNGGVEDITTIPDILGKSAGKKKIYYAEATTPVEAGKRLVHARLINRKPLPRVLINAHGDSEVVEFSESPDGHLTTDNIRDLRLDEVMLRGGDAYVSACESGLGISKAIADEFDLRTVGSLTTMTGIDRRWGRHRILNAESTPTPAVVHGGGRFSNALKRMGRRLLGRERYEKPKIEEPHPDM